VHKRRQRAILTEHPRVKKLYGNDRRTQYFAYAVIALQVGLAWWVRGSFARAVALGCTFGPFVDAAALCFIHEATHMLVFATPMYNRLIGIVTNCIMIMPISEIFKQHHSAHHKNLGDDSYDVDVPTAFEVRLVGNSPLRKALWLTCNMLILPVRSLARLGAVTDRYLIANWVACVAFGLASFAYSRATFLYLLLSMVNSQGLHPANTRQVQEHMFDGDDATRAPAELRAPTYSYYGIQNMVQLNVGWHLEHHDFPFIPWTRLPALHAMAGEKWYPRRRAHKSRGVLSMVNFVLNRNISLADFAH
jgi:sphingolipid 4-desaturase/C4-monooxygenase